jgi:hypothetical protein
VDGKTSLTSGLRNGVKALNDCGGGRTFMHKTDEKRHDSGQISHIQLQRSMTRNQEIGGVRRRPQFKILQTYTM